MRVHLDQWDRDVPVGQTHTDLRPCAGERGTVEVFANTSNCVVNVVGPMGGVIAGGTAVAGAGVVVGWTTPTARIGIQIQNTGAALGRYAISLSQFETTG